MPVLRKKLSTAQFTIYTNARRKLVEAQSALDHAQDLFRMTGLLILDHFGLDEQADVTIDDQTRELVIKERPDEEFVQQPPATPPA